MTLTQSNFKIRSSPAPRKSLRYKIGLLNLHQALSFRNLTIPEQVWNKKSFLNIYMSKNCETGAKMFIKLLATTFIYNSEPRKIRKT